MNVLIVSEPGVDGVFRYVETLIHFLLGQGVSVHFAYSDVRGGAGLRRLVERVESRGGRTLNLRVGNRPSFSDLAALLALRRLARDIRPDLIHCHSSKAGALARALPALGVLGVPLVYQPHAYIGMRPVRGRADFFYDAVERLLGRWSTTVTCSYDEQRYALHRLRVPPARVPAICNGVDTSRFTPGSPARRRELRAAFRLPPDAIVLGAMCRSSAQKDPLTLYLAFAAAARRDPRIVLFHVGQGELDPLLDAVVERHALEDRVIRLPFLATPADFYHAIDGFALASRYEGFSLALLEALAADLPIILSDAPGNGDLSHRPLSHLWIRHVGDQDGFADAILEWAAERASPRRSPCNHREIAETFYEQNRSLAKVLSLYRRLRPASPASAASPAYAQARA
jgi:glycosyltransferase involved in cell wall biosynthesis